MSLFVILFIAIQVIYNFFVNNSEIKYKIYNNNNEYVIKERFEKIKQNGQKIGSYYYEISDGNQVFYFRSIDKKYTGVTRLLADISIYKDNQVYCMYPIFKDTIKGIDVICSIDDIQYYYGSIIGNYVGLDKFVSDLAKKNYFHPSWTNNITASSLGSLSYYKENFFPAIQMTVWNYNGIVNVGPKFQKVFQPLYIKTFQNTIGSKVGEYYAFADIGNDANFDVINLLNVATGKETYFGLNQNIHKDFFIQGAIEDDLYIVDRVNKLQYKINVKLKTVEIVGSSTIKGQFYWNGKFIEKSIDEMIESKLVFGKDPIEVEGLDMRNVSRLDRAYDDGVYYYVYYQTLDNMKLYRIDKNNIKKKTFIFDMPHVSNIKYLDDKIYFISEDSIYGYHDAYGLKKQATYNELKNNTLNRLEIFLVE